MEGQSLEVAQGHGVVAKVAGGGHGSGASGKAGKMVLDLGRGKWGL